MAPDTFSLEGKVAIVTGSGRENGIGSAIALAFARNGASVVINYVSDSSASRAAKVAEKVKEFGAPVAVIQASVATPEGAKKLVQGTLSAFGTEKIDILVNNAGGPTNLNHVNMQNLTPKGMQDDFNLNYFGAMYMIQEVVPYIARGGRIINIGAMASLIYVPAHPAYGASKAAADHSTKVWAAELGKSKGVTVNTVAPSGVVTDPIITTRSHTDEGTWQMLSDMMSTRTKAADRWGTVEDIADIVLFVASEKSRWITGHVFPACGGFE